jgi:hypothetical protein
LIICIGRNIQYVNVQGLPLVACGLFFLRGVKKTVEKTGKRRVAELRNNHYIGGS